MTTDNLSNKFTVCFTIGPDRYWEYYNAMSSMLDLDPSVSNVLLVFNPYIHRDHDKLLDISEVRHSDIIKMSKFSSLAKCWNQCIAFSNTEYTIILNDDVVFTDPSVLVKIHEKHLEGYGIVHATENWSGFSIRKSIIPKVGWFDERFTHSWEDADYRLRMKRKNVDYYRFEPNIIRHTRSTRGRFQDDWDRSSSHFFTKWGIKELLSLLDISHVDTSDPGARKQLLEIGFFNDHFYDNLYDKVVEIDKTPDFYPELTKQYELDFCNVIEDIE